MFECCKRLRDNGDVAETVLPLQSTAPGDGAIRQRTAVDFEKLFHDRAERANRLASAGLLCAARAEIIAGRQSLSHLLPWPGGFELLRRLHNRRLSLLAEGTLGKFYAAIIKQ